MADEYEIRMAPAEIRVDANGIKVEGYAAVFNQEADIGGFFREVIQPGAFKDAIGRDDVIFNVDHEGLPLARTGSGTLTLSEDTHGLHMASELDGADPDVMQIIPKMKRGDLSKMSFAFRAIKEQWDDSGDIPLRTIMDAELFDVSIVSMPAYDGTEIGIRSLDKFRKETKQKNFNAAARRIRMKLDLGLRSKRTAD